MGTFLGEDVISIKTLPDGSGAEALRQVRHLVQVLGEDGCSQTVNRLVGSLDNLFDAAKLQNLLHWPENLFIKKIIN